MKLSSTRNLNLGSGKLFDTAMATIIKRKPRTICLQGKIDCLQPGGKFSKKIYYNLSPISFPIKNQFYTAD